MRREGDGGGEGEGGYYKTQHMTCVHTNINDNEKQDEETDCEMDNFL